VRRKLSGLLHFFLLAPALAVMIVLYVQPFVLSLYRSVLDEKTGSFTLKFFERAIGTYGRDAVFSLWTSLLATVITIGISIIIGAYLRLTTGTLRRFFNAIYRLPLFIPFVVIGQMMRTFLAPHGLLNNLLSGVGLIDPEFPIEFFNWSGLVFGFVWKQFAFATLLILGGFMMIEDEYLESARSVGAGTARIIVNILVPMAKSVIPIAFILVFASLISCFTYPYMLIGGAVPTTITVDIAHNVTYFGDWGIANALGVISYLMVSAAAIYYMRYIVGRGIYQ